MIVTCDEMRRIEDEAFAAGVSAEVLMEKAGSGLAAAAGQFFPQPGVCVVYAGKGNNAGDAFVAARHLQRAGWDVRIRLAYPVAELGVLCLRKFVEIRGELLVVNEAKPAPGRPLILVDGLLGLGAAGPLRPPLREMAAEINRLRRELHAAVVAVDLPSGLDGDGGVPGDGCVQADLTVTIGFAKRGLVADAAAGHVGRIAVVGLEEFAGATAGAAGVDLATPAELRGLLPPRAPDTHKSHYGRVGIVAGSTGFAGAAVLASTAAARAGAGLVTLFVPEDVYPIVAASCGPEVMVRPVGDLRDLASGGDFDVLAVGPGLGRGRDAEARDLVRDFPGPMVVDADGLNALAADPGVLAPANGPRLLTPHPGEMARLMPRPDGASRLAWATEFAERYPVALLLKGTRTVVVECGRTASLNPTGNPGMATGGMGDILTGVCAALAGQGLRLHDAGRLGAWLCGRAAERVISGGAQSQQSLLAGDLPRELGGAFQDLFRGCF